VHRRAHPVEHLAKEENMNQLSLSIEEASATTGIGRTKIYELISSGQLVARKVGTRTIILRSDIEAFLAGLQHYQKEQPNTVEVSHE